MDRMRYLQNLKEKKKSPAFDVFLEQVQLVGNCPVRVTNNIIGGKWKPVILNLVIHDVNRFGEMIHLVEGLSKKVLTTQLRELEADGILRRIADDQSTLKVEYSLTEKGRSIVPLIDEMCKWGMGAGDKGE